MTAVTGWEEAEPILATHRPPSPWVGPVVAMAVAAGLIATGHGAAAALLVVVATAVTVAARVSGRAEAVIGHATRLAGRVAFHALSIVLLAVVGLIVFVPVWLACTLLRWDPLGGFGDGRAGRWQRRDLASGGRPVPARPFADDRRRRVGRPRAHAALVAVVPFLIVAAVAVARQDRLVDIAYELLPERDGQAAGQQQPMPVVRTEVDPRTRPGDIDDVPNWFGGAGPRANNDPHVARGDEDWYAQYDVDSANLRYLLDPYLTIRHPDYQSAHINITDRVRRSWQPAGLDATDALEVWFFGGSALFGAEQRDEFTIPSQVARLAADEGRMLRVQNFAMPSYVAWQDQALLAQMLTERTPPDLIVVYDGYNDFGLYSGVGAPTEQSTLFADDIRQGLIDRGAQLVGGADEDPTPRTAEPSPANAARLYNLAVAAGRSSAAAAGVPILHFFQPSLWSRSTTADDPTLASLEIDRAFRDRFSDALDEMRADLRPEVVDLADALDGFEEIAYADEVHHNEPAAAVVASALYEAISPTLSILEAQRDAG
ncbi:MAG: hypothetical protein JNK12_02570 [Acidimicrobiales bacterium]|nr:hypothetical protein [Acidimicrobiales bacterium]